MAAVTGDNYHLCIGNPDLVHLSATVVHPLIIKTGGHCAAATAAANLMHPVGIQVDPSFQAAIENPARFLKKTMSEFHLGFAPIITGIVIGDLSGKAGAIDPDSLLFNIANQQIEYRHEFELVKSLRVMFFKPGPG